MFCIALWTVTVVTSTLAALRTSIKNVSWRVWRTRMPGKSLTQFCRLVIDNILESKCFQMTYALSNKWLNNVELKWFRCTIGSLTNANKLIVYDNGSISRIFLQIWGKKQLMKIQWSKILTLLNSMLSCFLQTGSHVVLSTANQKPCFVYSKMEGLLFDFDICRMSYKNLFYLIWTCFPSHGNRMIGTVNARSWLHLFDENCFSDEEKKTMMEMLRRVEQETCSPDSDDGMSAISNKQHWTSSKTILYVYYRRFSSKGNVWFMWAMVIKGDEE